jgi:hypothetical protein
MTTNLNVEAGEPPDDDGSRVYVPPPAADDDTATLGEALRWLAGAVAFAALVLVVAYLLAPILLGAVQL